jgi:hypothetical protein
MIVRETPTSFFCIAQHDHGHLAGVVAEQWPSNDFASAARRAQVLLAVREHDRAWIPLDEEPQWNEQLLAPHSFQTYPIAPKVTQYQAGIDEVVVLNAYAGLLCSLHFSSFPDLANTAAGLAFLRAETQRQQQLKAELELTTPQDAADLQFERELLRFCDNVSLYLCLNEPGSAKAVGHLWYRDGIPFPDRMVPSQQLLQANWQGPDRVHLHPFPFSHSFPVSISYKELAKADLTPQGLAASYQEAPQKVFRFWLVGSIGP